MHLVPYSIISAGAFVALKTAVVVPLGLACLVLLVVIPAAAWRGKLSVPLYALLALAAGVIAFAAGTVAGAPSVRGTPLGVVVSLIFFLLVATAIGCFLSMLFYRQPPDSQELSEENRDSGPPASEPDR